MNVITGINCLLFFFICYVSLLSDSPDDNTDDDDLQAAIQASLADAGY